jgi:diaminopimelate decarboxylase
MTEIALPAMVLRNRFVAKWVRDRRISVDVQTGDELAVAIAVGVHPSLLTVWAEALGAPELGAALNLGVGRVVVGSVEEIEVLRSLAAQQRQGVVVRMADVNAPIFGTTDIGDRVRRGFRFDSNEADTAMAAILDHKWLNLVGLHGEVSSQVHDFISYRAAIGQMTAEMVQVRRDHGIVLTRLGLGGGRAVLFGDWTVELPKLATQINESLDYACTAMRFPQPLVVLSGGAATFSSVLP